MNGLLYTLGELTVYAATFGSVFLIVKLIEKIRNYCGYNDQDKKS